MIPHSHKHICTHDPNASQLTGPKQTSPVDGKTAPAGLIVKEVASLVESRCSLHHAEANQGRKYRWQGYS